MLKIVSCVLILIASTVLVESNDLLDPVERARINPALLPARAAGAPLQNLLRNPNPLLTPSAAAVTLHKQSENDGNGNFRYSFESSDGTKQEQVGIFKPGNELNQEGIQAVQGSYEYVSPEGIPITVNYVADENGFRATGDHIPSGGQETVKRNAELGFLNPSTVDPTLIRQSLALGNKRLNPLLDPVNPGLLTREQLLLRQLNGPYNYNGINGINRFNGLHGHGLHGINGFHGINGINGLNGVHDINGINGFRGYPAAAGLGHGHGLGYPYNRYLGSQYPYNYQSSSALYNPLSNQRHIANPYVNNPNSLYPYNRVAPSASGLGLGLGVNALTHPGLVHPNSNRIFP